MEKFNSRPDEVALKTQISRNIEIDLREMQGETELPPALQPENNIILLIRSGMENRNLETVRKWYPNARTTEDTINGLLDVILIWVNMARRELVICYFKKY